MTGKVGFWRNATLAQSVQNVLTSDRDQLASGIKWGTAVCRVCSSSTVSPALVKAGRRATSTQTSSSTTTISNDQAEEDIQNLLDYNDYSPTSESSMLDYDDYSLNQSDESLSPIEDHVDPDLMQDLPTMIPQSDIRSTSTSRQLDPETKISSLSTGYMPEVSLGPTTRSSSVSIISLPSDSESKP